MTSILDIAPLSESVEVGRDQKVEVQGISAKAITSLLFAFPALQKIIAERKTSPDEITGLVMQFPLAVAMTIAAALGHEGDDKYIDWAEKRTAGEQFAIVKAALGLTFPKGLSQFVSEVGALLPSVPSLNSGDDLGKEADTKSPEPSAS